MKKNNKRFKLKLIWLIVVVLNTALFLLLSSSTKIAEFLSKTLNRYYNYLIGSISSLLPFSLFELLVIIFIIIIITYIVLFFRNIFKKKYSKIVRRTTTLLLLVASIISAYIAITKPCYNRDSLKLPQYANKVSNEEVKNICIYYFDKISSLSNSLERDSDGNVDMSKYYTYNELAEQMKKEYERIDNDYISSYTSTAKSLYNSWLLSEMNVTGITFSLTGEANVNTAMPSIDIPFTMAHELAHTKGIMREDDANLLATYICLTSTDSFIQYSGYFRTYSRLLSAAYYTSDKATYTDICSHLPASLLKEAQNYYKYFEEHDTLDKIQDTINDWYLKLSGVQTGVDSYIDVENSTDTGSVRDDGTKIYEVEFSTQQKLLFYLYYNK